MKKFLFLTLAFCLNAMFLTAQTSPKSAKLVTIDDNYQAALKKAKKMDRPIFAIVYTMSCGLGLLNETLNNDSVISFLNENFVTLIIRFDHEANQTFLLKYTFYQGNRIKMYN